MAVNEHLIPDNDRQRLEKLRDYQILDTHAENTFDNIAQMASQIFGTSSAFITFVDDDRVFFKANLSTLDANEIDRNDSLCSRAILDDQVTVFNDTHTIPELLASPYVAAKGGIRFYAGAPLKSPEGFNMGTVCVVDSVPRTATPQQLEMLKTLSKIVIEKLEERLRYRKNIKAQVDLMNIALHEIKNPLASIKLANEILTKVAHKKDEMAVLIKSSVLRIQHKLTELLKQSELQEKDLSLSVEETDLTEIFEKVMGNFELLAAKKNQKIILQVTNHLPKIDADSAKLSDILHNLVSNAVKYSHPGTRINIVAENTGGHVRIEVQDQGQGLNEDDLERLFTKFAKLSSTPTGKETSNGIGLSITKAFIELHNGTIEAKSDGKGKGATFIVKLPLKFRSMDETALAS